MTAPKTDIPQLTPPYSSDSLKAIDITTLLPQRQPMLMIDYMDEFTEQRCSTLFKVKESCIFVENGHLSVAGIIENMAQTCAARLGFVDRHIRGGKISIGYIGAVKNLYLTGLPSVGEVLRTTISTVTEAFGMTLVEAQVCIGKETIARCELKIALAPEQ